MEQLRQSLEHVFKPYDPSEVYDSLIMTSRIPGALRDWNSVNVEDEVMLKEIWKHLRANIICIDYFLSNLGISSSIATFYMLHSNCSDSILTPCKAVLDQAVSIGLGPRTFAERIRIDRDRRQIGDP